MIAAGSQALELALALWRVPSRVAQARRRALPADLKLLIQLAAGDDDLAARCAEASGETPQVVKEAAAFYLQQVLFSPDADSYRVLGVAPDAPEDLIKQHYRWLVRWLHPDRNPDDWEAMYADRVNRAWQDLRQPARRADYDRGRAATAAPPPPTPDDEDLWGDASPQPLPGSAAWQDEPAPSSSRGARGAVLSLLALAMIGAGAWWTWPMLREDARASQDPPSSALAAAADDVAAPPLPMVEGAGDAPTAAMADAVIEQRALDALQDARAGEPQLELIRVPPGTAPVPRPVPLEPAPPPAAATGLAARAQVPRGTTEASPSREPAPATTRVPDARLAAAPVAAPAIAPASAAARAPSADASPTPSPRIDAAVDTAPTQAEAEILLTDFRRAYAAGDINALMQLFARDARNNRGGRDAIAYDYQSLFAGSESRSLAFESLAWVPGRRITTVNARFLAEVKRPGQWRATRSRGDIRFDIGREDGQARIRTIWHDTD